jgi:hypothetical protein
VYTAYEDLGRMKEGLSFTNAEHADKLFEP